MQESAGIGFIAAGIVLAAYLFFSVSNMLSEAVSNWLFGLCGLVSYGLPVLFIGMGILYIGGRGGAKVPGSGWYMALGVLALLALVQAITDGNVENVKFMDYLGTAWAHGTTAHLGGGFVGAVLCYPFLALGGKILCDTLLIAVLIICGIFVSGVSIRDASDKFTDAVADAVMSSREERQEERIRRTEEKQKLFALDLNDRDTLAEPPAKGKKKKTKKQALEDDDGLNLLPTDGTLRSKSGGTARGGKVEKVHSDIWDKLDELEPAVDGDLVITKEEKKGAKKPAKELPDTEKLFGNQTPPAEKKKKTAKAVKDPDPMAGITFTNAPDYAPPPFTLLNSSDVIYGKGSESPAEKARVLLETLDNFHIPAKVTDITVGPVLTRFELQPAPGIRVSRITSLSNDIALALAAQRVRIEAPIPGKAAVGIEIPNKEIITVVLRDIVESREFMNASSVITMALGKDISGKTMVADLGKMPHMLIAGATGSGKSVCINDIIVSMVYKSSPADVRMVLIDPKMVELSVYASLPHLLIPVVTDPKKAAGALRWAVNEMMQRYKRFSEAGVRDLSKFNDMQELPENRLPKIVVIIDELADLMLVAPDEVEDSICRIAQLGRASGIHLIVATQRPSADVITGLIKANIPSRCAFAVSSGIDSRIILDSTGAEKLLGRGDMLFHPNGAGKPTRLQAAFVSDEEVERVVGYFKQLDTKPTFDEQILADMQSVGKGGPAGGAFGEGKQEDELIGEAVRISLESGQASISMVQRRLRVGYARAARLVDMMEQEGYISPFDGSKARKVLITRAKFEELFGDGTPVAEAPPEQGDGPEGR